MAEGLRHLTPASKGRSDQESANYGPSRVCDKIQRTREPIVKKQQLAQLDAARDNKPEYSELPQVSFRICQGRNCAERNEKRDFGRRFDELVIEPSGNSADMEESQDLGQLTVHRLINRTGPECDQGQ
jgi:hypothetical protein